MARVAGLANARVQTVLTYRFLLAHLVQPEGIRQ
jgi:hypothetical protein